MVPAAAVQRAGRCLGLAIVTPFLALLVLGLIDMEKKWINASLAIVGILNAALVFRLLWAIHTDIEALIGPIDPANAGRA